MEYSVQDVFNKFGSRYLDIYYNTYDKLNVFNHIKLCRTKKMGINIYKCSSCGKQVYVYKSCMDRHCPNCYYKKLTFDNLLEAHKRASFNKSNRYEVLKFNIDLETNILVSLKNRTYKLSPYKTFTIYEPKERIIKCLPYKDRIVHQWYIYEFVKPYIIPRLIDTTCACIDGRGTHYAVKLTRKYMRIMKRKCNNYYILKLDIKKFF